MAEIGALREPVVLSTRALAEKLGASQQSASRYVRSLMKLGLVNRRGRALSVTEEGVRELASLQHRLGMLLSALRFLEVKGTAFTGIGEGAYYIKQKGYRDQFMKKLGFDPYPGTLNLRLASLEDRFKLDALPAIRIEGFKSGGRTFGPAKCYEAVINDREKGAVVLAMRSHYGPSVIELISPVYLRERLNIKDGDVVEVKIPLSKGPQLSSLA